MKAGNETFQKGHLAIMLIAGTGIRFFYGYFSKAWLGSPDQLAWGLSIDMMLQSGKWGYSELMHAPHEGGGFLISLFSLLFRPLQFLLPSLSAAALMIDMIGRLIQITITRKLFGRETAFWFGLWTIISVPLLIPWATVNFGLHSLFSFVPFVFVYLLSKYRDHKYLPVLCGIICGIAVSLSYDSIILVIASIGFLLSLKNSSKVHFSNLLKFIVIFTLFLLPHVIARIYLNTTSSLIPESFLSVRGVPLTDGLNISRFANLCTVWFRPLPGSFLLSSIYFLPASVQTGIVFLFLLSGMLFFTINSAIGREEKNLSICVIFLFIAAYAVSPFYEGNYNEKSYVYYRHLCYIIPFVTVIVIAGFIQSGKLKFYFVGAWLLLGSIASVLYVGDTHKIDHPAYRAAGWILAKKYVYHTDNLFRIHTNTEPAFQEELLIGFGWGLSATILENRTDQGAIEKLIQIVKQCPGKYQPEILQGIHYSFSKGITPVLDKKLEGMLDYRLKESNH